MQETPFRASPPLALRTPTALVRELATPPLLNATSGDRTELLVLMFHRAQAGTLGNSPAMLDAHFAHVAANYPCVLPGEPLQAGCLNVCLSFDDGCLDFYQTVLPLLEIHRLRALLAIPPGLIVDSPAVPYKASAELCSWAELREIAASGRVAFAAHGMTHIRLDNPAVDLGREVSDPGLVLTVKLLLTIESFVFPFGRFSPLALQTARTHYHHVFRIGGAINTGWDASVLYRVSADNLTGPADIFAPAKLRRYRLRRWWNRLRCR